MKIIVAPVAIVLLVGLLSGVTACSKDKPKQESKPAQFAPQFKPRMHLSARRYTELFRLMVDLSPDRRREAMARNLGLSEYRIYGKEINQVLRDLFNVAPDRRQEVLARGLSPIFEDLNRGAWEDLAVVTRYRRGQAFLGACTADGKPLLDPVVADYAEFEYLLLAMAMAYEARTGDFEDEKAHRLALSVMLDPEWFFLAPPPAGSEKYVEGPFEPLQGLAVTISPTAIRVGTEAVAEVACRIGERDCTKEELWELDGCSFDRGSSPCNEVSFQIPMEFKENLDPNSLIVASLQRHLKVRTARKLEALDALARKFRGRITLFIHPAIPFRMLMEIIYTSGKVGFPGRGGLSEFHLRTYPRSLETGIVDRQVRLPRFPDTRRPDELVPTLLVSEDMFILRLAGGAVAEGGAIETVFRKKKQPVCGGGNVTEEYDYAGLYTKLVELRNRREYDFSETIQLGAANAVPWHVVSRIFDTVTSRREKDSYTDLCELLDAPARTERKNDASGDPHEVPMGLFPDVVLVMM